MAKYKYSNLAIKDLDSIADYTYKNWGKNQLNAYRDLLKKASSTIADFPSMGRPYTTQAGKVYHKYSVGEHALFFRTTEYGVFIVRVLHLMMDFDRHLD